MQRRHFELIADVIARVDFPSWGLPSATVDERNEWAKEWLAHLFADALAGTNERFNRERFIKACGVAPHGFCPDCSWPLDEDGSCGSGGCDE